MALFAELKRRNVIRVAGAYLALGWVVTQATTTLAPVLHLPESIASIVVWIGVIGFPFVLAFAWVYELTPEGLKRESEVERTGSITHVTARRLDWLIVAMLVVAIAMFGYREFVPREQATGSSAAAAVGAGHARDTAAESGAIPAEENRGHGPLPRPTSQAVPDARSIAVLPFVDMSAAQDQAYMSDGIAEELLNLLAKIPELQVTSRSSAFAFKGEKIDLAEVARKLHVAHILEGSVRTAGNRVRITAQLIDARADKHLWSESYDRGLDDIFAVQDEIAGAVVTQLKVKLLGAAPKSTAVEPAAYALYLQAREMRRQANIESWQGAVELARQALAIDPQYAAAWEVMGSSYLLLAGQGMLGSFDEGYAQARETIAKALAIDPDYAPAHARLADIALQIDNDVPAAAQHLRRAIELAPADENVLSAASGLAGSLGRTEQQLAIDRLRAERDPVNPRAHSDLGWDLVCAGRLDESIVSMRTALSLSPGAENTHAAIAYALLHKGDIDGALAEAQLEPMEFWRLMGVATVLHARGQRAEAEAALREMITKFEKVAAFQIAMVFAEAGEADQAFEWLDKAVRYRDPGVSIVVVQPHFRSLHQDPRWLEFLRRIGRAPEQLAAIDFDFKL